MWADAVDDEKLRLLSPGDRWYFVALMCCKSSGMLDKGDSEELLRRKLCVKLDITAPELEELRRRLSEVALIIDGFQPKRWEKRQYVGDRGMPEGESRKNQRGYIYFIGSESGPVKIGYSRNPWARVKDISTSNHDTVELLAVVRTNEVSERRIHELLADYRSTGEWFRRDDFIDRLIAAIKGGISTDSELYAYVATLRSSDVATTVLLLPATSETESDTEKNKNPAGRAPVSESQDLDPGAYLVWTAGIDLIGAEKRGLMGKLVKQHGITIVAGKIAELMAMSEKPRDPAAYLVGALRKLERRFVC
jgi:hypothetical protein